MLVATLALALSGGAALAGTIKVGVVGPFSGPAALQGRNFQAGIEAWLALNGSTVGADTIEIVYRDLPSANPQQSAALTQDLIVGEGVQYLAGYYYTPDAMAAAPMLEEANVPMVIFNAATSAIMNASPYVVRTSFTTWQTSTPMAAVARERGISKAITVVSDYGPGVDAENAFVAGFTKAGGAIVNASDLTFPAVGAYDGMFVISKMIAATGGRQDAKAAVEAVKGLSWISPRGPVSIDPMSRHITQDIYLREVAKIDGRYINEEIQTFAQQGDPGWKAP
jgi:ABC-type branched-subunit amino acid transport system substrate-binding protein